MNALVAYKRRNRADFEASNRPFHERTARGKALTMASWCSDPSKILAYVTYYYGNSRGLTRKDCEDMIAWHRKPTGRTVPDWEPTKPKSVLRLVEPKSEPVAPLAVAVEEEQPLPPAPPTDGFDVRVLVTRVAKAFGITYGELIGDCRRHVFVEARAVIVAVLFERGWSYPRIGRVLRHSEHSSALHSRRQFPIYAERNNKVMRCYLRYRPKNAAVRAL